MAVSIVVFEQHPDPLAEALIAPGPEPSRSSDLMLFGQFVGSWHLRWERMSPVTGQDRAEGELHVGWVLGGRAVQDVWIVPGPSATRARESSSAFHGSTLRFYDPRIGAWRSTWIEPINGRVRRFIGHASGDGIRLLSDDDAPALRWSFTDIRADSFTWTGELLQPDRGWVLEERMYATRTTGR